VGLERGGTKGKGKEAKGVFHVDEATILSPFPSAKGKLEGKKEYEGEVGIQEEAPKDRLDRLFLFSVHEKLTMFRLLRETEGVERQKRTT